MKYIKYIPVEYKDIKRPEGKSYGFIGQNIFVPPNLLRFGWDGVKYAVITKTPKGYAVARFTNDEGGWCRTRADFDMWRKIVKNGDFFDLFLLLRLYWHDADPRAQTLGKKYANLRAWADEDLEKRGYVYATFEAYDIYPTDVPYKIKDNERQEAYERLYKLQKEFNEKLPKVDLEWVKNKLALFDSKSEMIAELRWRWEGRLDYMLMDIARKEGYNPDYIPEGWEKIAKEIIKKA